MTAKEQLIGQLVGLARATDGNEHLINETATSLIRRILLLPENAVSESVLDSMAEEITRQKQAMVPDCFHCASPCGRTSAFDLDSLENGPDNQKAFKFRILDDLRQLAHYPESTEVLYKGLILLGMEECPPELHEFWEQIITEILG